MRLNARFCIWSATILIFGCAVVGYVYFRSKDYRNGPVVSISYPQNGATVVSAVTEVSGIAKNVSSISINGKKVFLDERGTLSEKLLLTEGYNIITVKAEDRFRRSIEKKLELIYHP